MKASQSSGLKQFAFIPLWSTVHLLWWMAIFFLGRLFFLLYHSEKLKPSSGFEVFTAFFSGARVDLAMACYLSAPAVLMSLFLSSRHRMVLTKLAYRINQVLLLLVAFIYSAELPLYAEWNQKLNAKALWFLWQPSEVFHTASWGQLVFGLIGVAAFVALGSWVYLLFTKWTQHFEPHWKPSTVSFIVFAPVLATAARGGWSPIPVQISDAYFSKNMMLNDAASNSVFYLMSNVLQHMEAVEPYRFYPSQEARNKIDVLFKPQKDTSIIFINNPKPNICLIVLEGWSANAVGALGGISGLTPNFDRIISEGLAFDSCYASGNLSDQGMGAVFSAFPAQPRTSIVTIPSKYPALPSLLAPLKEKGYSSAFVFGGQLIYGNIKSYMYHNKFDQIQEEADFPSSCYRGRLGVHDGDLFERQLQQMDGMKQPFFAASFTQSTHGPYDIPVNGRIKTGGSSMGYFNGLHYADSVLGVFLQKAATRPWFNNTLFVFVSDHHHSTPLNTAYHSPGYRRIPLVFYGAAMKPEFKNSKNHRVCSQLDLAATLLKQLGFDSRRFNWSNNLMNPYSKEFAAYTFDEGIGWVKPGEQLVFHVGGNRLDYLKVASESRKALLLQEAKAYLQRVTEDFSAY